MSIEDYSLELWKDDGWYSVPFRRSSVAALPLQLEPGAKREAFLSLIDVDGENLTPGRWRLCMRYGVGDEVSRDWEACAEFELN